MTKRRRSPPAEPEIGREATTTKLIEAAGHVFAERGYHDATIREICFRADTNIAAVNYHFGDKLGLYTAVLRESIRSGHQEDVRAALNRNAPPDVILRGIIRARLKSSFGADRPDWQFRLIVHELANPTPALPQVVNEILRPMYERVLEIIGVMIGFPPDAEKTRLCQHSIIGQVFLYAIGRPLLGQLWPELTMTPEQLDRIADHIADFSMAYLTEVRAQSARAKRRRPKHS